MVFEKIKALISDQFNYNENDITMETTFEDIGADSLDIVEMVMALEEEFDIQIEDEDVENITNVGSVVEYIQSKI